MKAQVFLDGNKRSAVIFANHFLIAHGQGFIVIPKRHVPKFKKLLAACYEGGDAGIIEAFKKRTAGRVFDGPASTGAMRGIGGCSLNAEGKARAAWRGQRRLFCLFQVVVNS